jgi:hypothetical protein
MVLVEWYEVDEEGGGLDRWTVVVVGRPRDFGSSRLTCALWLQTAKGDGTSSVLALLAR